MKDPLQVQPTPYDVLDIDRSAGPAEIDKAFKAGLGKGVNPSKLTGAKKALERPVDRALLDLFQYDPGVLARLRPDPRAEPGCLALRARSATSEAWEGQLRRSFPDYGMAHALAVLWYWWALDASERLAAGGQADLEGSPGFDALWEGAIAYWAMVQSADDYWDKQATVPKAVIPEVRRVLSERLPGDLQRFAQHHRDAGQEELADQYRRLELMLATEVKTAKALAGAGYGTSAGPLWCGALMLGRLSLLDSIRDQVSSDLAAQPADETLQSLTRALSPHFRIAALIERKEPQAALDAIAALPAGAKRSNEVKELKARALLLKGRQEESLGRTREAVTLWKEASGCGPPAALAGEICEVASDAALAAATALQSRDRKEAIAILELAESFAATEKLNRTLGELVADRGIEAVVKAQKEFEKNPSAEGASKLKQAIEKGLVDLDRGAALGSTRAKEQADVARQLLAQLGGLGGGMDGFGDGMDGLPGPVQSLLQEAGEAAKRGNLETSIRKLRSALGMVSSGSDAHTEISKMLSAALSGHAVSVVNSTMEGAAHLGRDTIAERLQEALQELTEALQLDPTNEHAQNNGKSLLEMMGKLGVPLFAGMAPLGLGGLATPSRPESRGWLHFSLVFAGFLAAGVLGVCSFVGFSDPTPHRFTLWVRAVCQASPLDPGLLWLGYAFAILGSLFLVFTLQGFEAGLAPFGQVFEARWWKKAAFYKLTELALYSYLLLFTWSAITYRGPPRLVESPPDWEPAPAEQITPASPGAAEEGPRTEAPTTGTPAAPAEVPDATTPEAAKPEAPALDLSDLSWMATEPVPPATVTALLRRVTGLAEGDREGALARLDSAGAGAGESVRATLTLLHSATAEERGDLEAARSGYHRLLTIDGEGAYGGTARLRLEVLDARDVGALEKALLAQARESGDTIWARTRGGWVEEAAPRAALLALMDLRADRLTVRLFRFLSEHAFAAPPAAYLRVFSYVLILWTLIQLPMFFRMADLARAAPALGPQIARLQEQHKGDQATLAKKLQEAYAQHGVSPLWGCLHSLIDLAVVVLFFFAFRAYAPQLALDGARFYWATDLLDRNLGVLALWGAVGLLHQLTLPKLVPDSGGALVSKAVLGLVIVCPLVWWMRWPAWFLLFWTMLLCWALLMQTIVGWLRRRSA